MKKYFKCLFWFVLNWGAYLLNDIENENEENSDGCGFVPIYIYQLRDIGWCRRSEIFMYYVVTNGYSH